MSKRSRTKGHSFEREIAAQLRVVYPEARRQLEYHSRDARGIDIQETGPFRFQCKKLKKYSPLSALNEVQCMEFAGEIPVLVTAGDALRPIVALPLDAFLDILKALPKEFLE